MKNLLITLGLFAGILFLIWQSGAQQPWAEDVELNMEPDASHPDSILFWADNVPANDPGYSYFWFFDDGGFSMEANPKYVFMGTGNRGVYLELTPLYDKGDKPTRMYFDPAISSSTASAEPEVPVDFLGIFSNRSPRAGDSITYVLTYGKHCQEITPPDRIEITYDPELMERKEHKEFHKETFTEISAGSIIYTDLSNEPDGLAKRIFLTFRVMDEVATTTSIPFSAQIFFGNDAECNPPPVTNIQEAVLSHDPNYIVADQEKICGPVVKGRTVTYTIHFQNAGAGEAGNVEVRAFLPAFFDESKVSTNYPPVAPADFRITPERELVWTLSKSKNTLGGGNGLKGTAQKGYGIYFFEEDTRDSVVFVASFGPDTIVPSFFKPCQSIYIQAEIVFDCNVPIRTNFYRTEINCIENPQDSICQCKGEKPLDKPRKIYGPPPATLASGAGAGTSIVWYPPAYISDPFSADTVVTPPRSISYIASMGKDCERSAVLFPVEVSCDLDISTQLKLNGCRFFPPNKKVDSGDITATALTNSPAENLVWNWECGDINKTVNGKTLTMPSMAPGIYTLTVKDTVNGCWAEKTVRIPSKCPPITFPVFPAIIAIIAILALVLWRKKRKGK